MPNFDEKTARGWPLPFRSNTLEFDVERLRETFNAIDEALSAFEEGTKTLLNERVAGLEEKQYILDERMDVIAGQTTEDSEILDARVDAKGIVHSNLGHNLRTLHSQIIEINETLRFNFQAIQGLLRQSGALAEAQMQGELNSQDAHERRKQEIQRTNERIDEEIQTRETSDLAIHKELVQEFLSRNQQDDGFQKQINDTAEAIIRTAVNLSEALERRKQALQQEIHARIAEDENLQEQVSENSNKIKQEANQRTEHDTAISETLDAEILARIESEKGLARQINSNSEANLQTALTLQEINERRKSDLLHEEKLRIVNDAELLKEINSLAQSFLTNALNLNEALERRKQALQQEIHARIAEDENLQEQISRNAQKIQQETEQRAESDAEIHEALDVHKDEINAEAQARVEGDKGLARQSNANAEAILRTGLTRLYNELCKKKKYRRLA